MVLVDLDGAWPTVVIGAVIGGVVAGVGSIVSQVMSGKNITEVDWKDVGIDALSGVVTGAIAGTGAGLIGLAVGGGAVGAGNYIAKTTIHDEWKEKSVAQHIVEGSLSVFEWSVATVAGGSMKEERLLINGAREELSFANAMLVSEATRGISARVFFEAVKKDVTRALGKTLWETFYKSLIRTTIVGGVDVLYNLYFKDELTDFIEVECVQD